METLKINPENLWPAKRVMSHLGISKAHLFNLGKKFGWKKLQFPSLAENPRGAQRVFYDITEIVETLEPKEN